MTGVAWGFLGSWWGGAALGYAAGVAATVGTRPPLPLREVAWGMLAVIGVVAAATAFTGVNVARHAELFDIRFGPGLDGVIPPDRQRAAFAVACTHAATYVTAVAGSVALCVWVSVRRKSLTPRSADRTASRAAVGGTGSAASR
jgi:hypothetical protein